LPILLEKFTFSGCEGACTAAKGVTPTVIEIFKGLAAELGPDLEGSVHPSPGLILEKCKAGLTCTYTSSSVTLSYNVANTKLYVKEFPLIRSEKSSMLCPPEVFITGEYLLLKDIAEESLFITERP